MVISQKEMPSVFFLSPPFRSVLFVVMASAGASFGKVAISITIERAITGRVEAFLRKMGEMFAFVGSQYRVEVGEREFYIDLCSITS
jgi:hypothetical protein